MSGTTNPDKRPSPVQILDKNGNDIDGTNPLPVTLQGSTPSGSSSGALSWDDSAVLEASSLSKAFPGRLYELIAFNGGSALRYLHVYDASAVPNDGAVPKLVPIPIQPGGVASLSLKDGKFFSAGICWASSVTLATKTITGSADLWVNVGYA